VVILLILAAEVISYKIEETIDEILSLYEKIDIKNSNYFIDKYRLFAH
jgi:hypothetical protein